MAGEAEARVMSVEGTTTALQTGTGTNLAREGLPEKQGTLDGLKGNSKLCFLLLHGKSLTVTWVMALVFPV